MRDGEEDRMRPQEEGKKKRKKEKEEEREKKGGGKRKKREVEGHLRETTKMEEGGCKMPGGGKGKLPGETLGFEG